LASGIAQPANQSPAGNSVHGKAAVTAGVATVTVEANGSLICPMADAKGGLAAAALRHSMRLPMATMENGTRNLSEATSHGA